MNAYELADELQDLHGLYCEDAANMLRQQADRIAELEKDLEGCEYFLKAQTKPCEPLCKPSVCNCVKEKKNDRRSDYSN